MKSFLKWAAAFILILWLVGQFSDSSSSTSSSSASAANSEESAPSGYERGRTCSACEGTGRYTRDLALVPNTKGNFCASCSGKGFNWQKK